MNLTQFLNDMLEGTITTIAGVGYRTGISAKEADAGWPFGVVRRPDGDLIVNDYHGNRIFRIDQQGILHAFAGDGVPGDSGDGGPAINARVDGPHDLALDKHGNLYFSDLHNQTFRRIDYETGIITRVAGSGQVGRGGDGGPALDAEMDTTCGIAIDNDGNLYLSSEWTNNIRRVNSETGIIELFAGQDARHYPSEQGTSRPASGPGYSLGGYHGDGGPAKDAAFFHPEHLAMDSRDNLYVCDNSNDRIRKIDMETGIVTTVLGNGQRSSSGDGGLAIEASTLMPDAICTDSNDNLYVGEKYGFRVRKVDAGTGIVTTLVGNGVPGNGGENVLGSETECNSCEGGIWADPDGTVFWSDCSGRLRRYDGETGLVSTVFGGTSVNDGPALEAFVSGPQGISVAPNGHIYWADRMNQCIRVLEPGTWETRVIAGNGARAYGGDNGPATEAYLGNPCDVSVDSQGRVVIADMRHGHVRRVDNDGIIRNIAGAAFQWDKGDGGPAIGANLSYPVAVAHDSKDNIYIGDGIGRIRRVDAQTGTIETVVGKGLAGYSGDHGPATQAHIGNPQGIYLDDVGALYFADSTYHVIRKVDTYGVITTVAGTGQEGSSPDGAIASKAKISRPQSVVVGSNRTVYFTDTGNRKVRRITIDGSLETVAGSDTPGDYGDHGSATEAGLNEPHGIAIYGGCVLLISDYYNNKIRAVKLPKN
ncbi:MAG: hypothetical protein QGF12_03010 [SAR202 cluster bacterium]|nr:hypothetical protein [SAR202 cluster bacterium]